MIPEYSIKNRIRCLWYGGHVWVTVTRPYRIKLGTACTHFCFWCFKRKIDPTIQIQDYVPEDYV